MTLLERLLRRAIRFPRDRSVPRPADHPASERIGEAVAVAEREISLRVAGGTVVLQLAEKLGRGSELGPAIDRALELAPDDADLLFARAEAYDLVGDPERGRALRERVLRLRPDHFDAAMRQRHPGEWPHLFTYVGWSEATGRVPPVLLSQQRDGQLVQIVRDALSLTPLILIRLPRERFPAIVEQCSWRPIWVETPHGPLFMSSVMLGPASAVLRSDLCLSPYPLERVDPRHDNWLIHRICQAASVFLVVHDGEEVLLNRRLILAREARRELAAIRRCVARLELPPDHEQRLQRAVGWCAGRGRPPCGLWNT